eukprot:CAMPEP_0177629774 /NCGR_PEP_ID=MMETSP0447-20121125/847_1 /TAXON_ID=0 /ORGANISM="Stygamoeba regulata, Strain BSH-02190019" /LENGTH=150 /DNA_ID=CAMNT_0019131117 /DNA_START=314 /DNA_END=767 /DNA_ORIENTATION=+
MDDGICRTDINSKLEEIVFFQRDKVLFPLPDIRAGTKDIRKNLFSAVGELPAATVLHRQSHNASQSMKGPVNEDHLVKKEEATYELAARGYSDVGLDDQTHGGAGHWTPEIHDRQSQRSEVRSESRVGFSHWEEGMRTEPRPELVAGPIV